MELRNVRTRDDLIKFLVETGRSSEEKAAGTADWFVLCSNARLIFDGYSVKDLASTLKDGIAAFEPEKDVADFLETIFVDAEDDDALQEAESNLLELVVTHFGE